VDPQSASALHNRIVACEAVFEHETAQLKKIRLVDGVGPGVGLVPIFGVITVKVLIAVGSVRFVQNKHNP
jgi:hypothetical protein